jgi:DNA polymerase III delta prime subunit
MADVEAFTGQAHALAQLMQWLSMPRVNLEPIVVLEGPPGTGKTWLTERLADALESSTTTVFAVGDRQNVSRDLLPFKRIHRARFHAAHAAKTLLPEAAASIPHFGSAIRALLQLVLSRGEMSQTERTSFLDADEREILFNLQRITGDDHLLLVMDALQVWDERSLALLTLMWSGVLSDSFPFLGRVSYLPVISTDEAPSSPEGFTKIQERLTTHKTIRLTYCRESDFAAVLSALGLDVSLPPTVLLELHRITLGHLAIAHQLVSYLNRTRDPTELLAQRTFIAFCDAILSDRIKKQGNQRDVLRRVLSCAAAIGVAFSEKEIACLSQLHEGELLTCIDEAQKLSILAGGEGTFSFCHEIFAKLLAASGQHERELHARFADCLRIIRPGDYATRAQHCSIGGLTELARAMSVHAELASMRSGRLAPQAILDGSHPADRYSRFLSLMARAQIAFDEGYYDQVLSLLENVDPTLNRTLLAEADIVIARCRIKLLNRRDQEAAADILAKWDSLRGEEPEIWQRVTVLHIVALAFIGSINEAKTAVTRFSTLVRDLRYDSDTIRNFQRLHLKCDSYLSPEAANANLIEAIQYFGPPADHLPARDPVNYYIGLANLVGNEIMRGDFRAALYATSRCRAYLESVAGTVDDVRFPRLDLVANNAIIAAFRCNEMPAVEAAGTMQLLLASTPLSNDRAILISNSVGYSLLANAPTDALTLLATYFEKFTVEHVTDPFYTYFVGNNLAASLIVAGQLERARNLWTLLTPLAEEASPILAPYLKPRHRIILDALGDDQVSLASCQRALDERRGASVGKTWLHLGHVVLLAELQFWSDD